MGLYRDCTTGSSSTIVSRPMVFFHLSGTLEELIPTCHACQAAYRVDKGGLGVGVGLEIRVEIRESIQFHATSFIAI